MFIASIENQPQIFITEAFYKIGIELCATDALNKGL